MSSTVKILAAMNVVLMLAVVALIALVLPSTANANPTKLRPAFATFEYVSQVDCDQQNPFVKASKRGVALDYLLREDMPFRNVVVTGGITTSTKSVKLPGDYFSTTVVTDVDAQEVSLGWSNLDTCQAQVMVGLR